LPNEHLPALRLVCLGGLQFAWRTKVPESIRRDCGEFGTFQDGTSFAISASAAVAGADVVLLAPSAHIERRPNQGMDPNYLIISWLYRFCIRYFAPLTSASNRAIPYPRAVPDINELCRVESCEGQQMVRTLVRHEQFGEGRVLASGNGQLRIVFFGADGADSEQIFA
jgi:hypothetical protein